MLKPCITKAVKGENLTEGEMEKAMAGIMEGKATDSQIASLVTAMRMKGETVEEISGAARAMRAKASKIFLTNHLLSLDRDEINVESETILDTCGTGGDGTQTFNVSTATAFVAAGGGVRVAKHGNRAVSSLCGSADVLESLGVHLDVTTTDVERCIREIGIGFLYAPLFHGAMKHATGPRREIGIRTLFNLLGPLTNPAGASAQVLGVYSLDLTEKIARVLKRLETKEAYVVCGEGTFDEISICGPTRISHLRDGGVETFEIVPEQYGFERVDPRAIRGGDARQNARIILDILEGNKGPKRDIVLLNAAAAFVVTGLDRDLPSGLKRAEDAIDSGAAMKKLTALIEFISQCKTFDMHQPGAFFHESAAR